jgi:hypothetical protein
LRLEDEEGFLKTLSTLPKDGLPVQRHQLIKNVKLFFSLILLLMEVNYDNSCFGAVCHHYYHFVVLYNDEKNHQNDLHIEIACVIKQSLL